MSKPSRVTLWVAVALAWSLGCSRQADSAKSREASSSTNRTTAAGVPLGLDDMKMDDVIVSVNGETLTKRKFIAKIKRDAWRFMNMSKMDESARAAMGRNVALRAIPNFVDMQLLSQEARRQKLLSQEDLKAKATAELKKLAGLTKQNENFLLGTNTFCRGMQQDAEESVLVQALMKQVSSNECSITDQEIKAVNDSIRLENEKLQTTNALKVARLNALRKEIVVDGADFGKLADRYSECMRSKPGNNGYWGEFERNSIADRKMRAAIFALKVGEVSEVLEDEEGFHLVKLLAVNAPEKNAKGETVNPESFKLAHILLAREPLLEILDPANIKMQLTAKIQAKRVEDLVAPLKEKAVIVYPHGTNFWTQLNKPAPTGVVTNLPAGMAGTNRVHIRRQPMPKVNFNAKGGKQ